MQVNTGAGCHLDAAHGGAGARAAGPGARAASLFIENVGNLVCPALFDLGELRKVVVISVTEGDDKPLKYPHMFAAADLVVLNKTDLLPYVDFDPERLTRDARTLNPDVEVLPRLGPDRAGTSTPGCRWLTLESESSAEWPLTHAPDRCCNEIRGVTQVEHEVGPANRAGPRPRPGRVGV